MDMKATHKLTYLPDGDEYLFSVLGNNYYWTTEGNPRWIGPFSLFTENYVENPKWLVEKVNKFKGNK